MIEKTNGIYKEKINQIFQDIKDDWQRKKMDYEIIDYMYCPPYSELVKFEYFYDKGDYKKAYQNLRSLVTYDGRELPDFHPFLCFCIIKAGEKRNL